VIGDSGMRQAVVKLRIPRTAIAPVRRERLLAVLDDRRPCGPRPVTVVSGPAGAGKTTLLATWASELERYRVAWITLDARDNDPSCLWREIAEALALSGIRDTTPDPAALMNVITAAENPVCLILDEADHLHDNEVLRGLETFVRQTPDNLRLVVAARTPPRLHLSRLRLEGRLLEIGMPDLAFTTAETEAHFRNHHLRLSQAELDLLTRRTEGWPAALRLAAMSLGEESGDTAKLDAFPAEDPALADYLAEEVLGPHPLRIHQFLRATSICETVSAELAAALAGNADSGEILDRLDRANALVDRVGRPGWYRYHPVLRSVLLAELDRRQPSVRSRLHRIAAEWFRDSGLPLTALEHAVAARHDSLVHELVEAYGLQEILSGQAESLHRMLSGLPNHGKPFTALIAAAAAISVNDAPAADEQLSTIGSLRSEHAHALHSTVLLQRAQLDGQATDPPDVLVATAAKHSGDPDLDTLSMLTRGAALLRLGELTHAERILRSAMGLAAEGHREHAVLQCMVQLAVISGARGDLLRMDEEAARAIQYATERGRETTAHCAAAYAMRAALAYLQANDARDFSRIARELFESPMTCLLDTVTRTDRAERIRDCWQRFSSTHVAPQLAAYVAPPALRIALQAGQQDWATEVVVYVEATLAHTAELALVDAALQAHRGKPGQARRLLAPILAGDAQAVAVTTKIDAWLLDASLLAAADDWHRAHNAVSKALALAEPMSALRPFLHGGPAVRDLLVKGAGRFGKLDRFVSAALARLPASPAPPVDRLTSREQDLLIELPSMRTTEEIAESLFVSVNTVKTHLRGIYRKLGVNHRRDAVTVARQRGLL
jgi:LuxR family maltose regulon positive regulatory protein